MPRSILFLLIQSMLILLFCSLSNRFSGFVIVMQTIYNITRMVDGKNDSFIRHLYGMHFLFIVRISQSVQNILVWPRSVHFIPTVTGSELTLVIHSSVTA